MSSSSDAVWTPLPRSNLSEDITDRLITNVLSGTFKFGERLPPERDLAKQLQVGRPTVREAIRALSVIGLVDVRAGEGTFIVDRHSDFVAKAFSWAMLMNAGTATEVIEARIAIETELASLAAQRATPQHVTELKRIVGEMAKAEDTEIWVDLDMKFHLEIASAAKSPALERLLEALQTILRQWMAIAERTSSSTHDTAVRQHRAIVRAISGGDSEAANQAIRAHLEDMGSRLVDAVETDAATKRNAELGNGR